MGFKESAAACTCECAVFEKGTRVYPLTGIYGPIKVKNHSSIHTRTPLAPAEQ